MGHPSCIPCECVGTLLEDPVGRPQKIIPTPDIVDNEPSYVVGEVVDSRWYGNPKSMFPPRFVQYMVAWEG